MVFGLLPNGEIDANAVIEIVIFFKESKKLKELKKAKKLKLSLLLKLTFKLFQAYFQLSDIFSRAESLR